MSYPDATPVIAEVAKQYQYTKPPPAVSHVQDLLSQILQAIMEWFRSFTVAVPQTTDSRGISSGLQYFLYGLGIIAAVVLIVVLLRRVKVRQQSQAKKKRGALDVEQELNALGWKGEADKLAQSGEFRGACRALYLSMLQVLDENKIAIFAPAKTNYEYRYLLNKHPEIRDSFMSVADVVELVWFGNKTAEADDYQQCLRLVNEIEQRARASAPPAEAAV